LDDRDVAKGLARRTPARGGKGSSVPSIAGACFWAKARAPAIRADRLLRASGSITCKHSPVLAGLLLSS
jgi:hypothetical protein